MPWYHQDLTRVKAEQLLLQDGQDGCFLVRNSESIPGVYGLCVLHQNVVHSYRIMPDEDGMLAVQASQGVQPKHYRALHELIENYTQPNQGLVCPLQWAIQSVAEEPQEEKDLSDGEEERPPLPPRVDSSGPSPTSSAASPRVIALQQKISDISKEGLPPALCTALAEFAACGGLSQDVEAARGGLPPTRLSRLLLACCQPLHTELDHVLSLLDHVGRAFNQPLVAAHTTSRASSVPTLADVITKLGTLSEGLSTFEKKILEALPALTGIQLPASHTLRNAANGALFEVKVDSHLSEFTRLGKKPLLRVEVEEGRLVMLRRNKDGLDEVDSYTHERILQLIKSQRFHNKLSIVFDRDRDKNNRRDFIFSDARKREAFCQLLQQMKVKHSHRDEPDMISVFVGTWNMGNAPPPRFLHTWLMSQGAGRTRDDATLTLAHDVYALGAQECPLSDREWAEGLRAALRDVTDVDFKSVAVHSLWSIKLAVFVKAEHEHRVSHVSSSSVKTGIANALGNKGAVGVSFMFNGTSFGFVNCHLTSGCEKVARRNQNYFDIIRQLSLGEKQLATFDLTCRFSHLFWFGDLNYRTDMEYADIMNHLRRREFDSILTMDQLNKERESTHIFNKFNEEDITFPPTYRYEKGSRDVYVWQKFKTTGVSAPGT
uniref:phosphatidylinositol-3,4,5-trisphosphate 5-phosphatase n=1 Tax=Petromyzon marinus TaxID=7757 RepID=A0AAJ7SMY3_PETMA|nr:phosphatidylinositol 3,4,5-trisphosphate 5-phosphatase 2-like [Petromyzon marinus]